MPIAASFSGRPGRRGRWYNQAIGGVIPQTGSLFAAGAPAANDSLGHIYYGVKSFIDTIEDPRQMLKSDLNTITAENPDIQKGATWILIYKELSHTRQTAWHKETEIKRHKGGVEFKN